MKFTKQLMIGAGGIGSHLAEPLARLLSFHENGVLDLTIVDGDKYEEKNAERQMYPAADLDKNKAQSLSDRVDLAIALDSKDHGCDPICEYINDEVDAASLMMKRLPAASGESLLVLLCVDNDATRRLFYDAMALLPHEHGTVCVIDCGNDLETSTVVTSFWNSRKSLLVSPVEMYENLRNPKDRTPGGGCLDQAPSTPQLMVANMTAALAALLTVQALLDGKKFTDVVQSNIRTFSMGVAGGEYGG